jgi:hypothetical protein
VPVGCQREIMCLYLFRLGQNDVRINAKMPSTPSRQGFIRCPVRPGPKAPTYLASWRSWHPPRWKRSAKPLRRQMSGLTWRDTPRQFHHAPDVVRCSYQSRIAKGK